MAAACGVYIFTRKGREAYVGRGDKDGLARMNASYREGPYDRTIRFIPTSSPRQNYLLECELFHTLDPIDNDRHPAVPRGTYWRCPINGCRWSLIPTPRSRK
jgi:hypothetical protein